MGSSIMESGLACEVIVAAPVGWLGCMAWLYEWQEAGRSMNERI